MESSKPESGLDGLFHDFKSGQWTAVREAVDQAGAVLRQGGIEPAIHAALGERMVVLSGHDKWEVRKALAHACLYLRHESFDRIMAALGQDDHDLVRNAAKRTLSRRSELSRTDMLKDQHGDLMLRWLAELEAKHGLRARNAARKVAERLNAQFVKELNHELVKVISPLDASLENIEVELLQSRSDKEDLHRHTRRARDRVRFLSAILDSLKALTHDVDTEFQTESLLSMVDEAVHLVRDRRKENHRLDAQVSISSDITLDASRHLMLQAISNIIQNSLEAYDATAARCTVRVTGTVEDNGRIKLVIADQGCGMSEEVMKDAFQLFATSKPHGTGFGLTIAKKIIEDDHGGSVHPQSAKGIGTTMTIYLPPTQEGREW
ncbi:MAG: sensor histidine kinase [Magnetococcales bacterium]|nr:sensor histidine kinase [Magnetococcales bacterium]